jgi:hypothetical protein
MPCHRRPVSWAPQACWKLLWFFVHVESTSCFNPSGSSLDFNSAGSIPSRPARFRGLRGKFLVHTGNASLSENIIERIDSSLSKTFGIPSGGLFVSTSRKGVHPVRHHFGCLLCREIGESLA